MEALQSSILDTIKKLVGLDKNYGAFDVDLVVSINSAFMILNQLGVGSEEPFCITSADETWEQFTTDINWFSLVKDYIYLRVRLLFDPPTSGVLHEAVERQISEFEWRLMVQANVVRSKNNEANGGDESEGDTGAMGCV